MYYDTGRIAFLNLETTEKLSVKCESISLGKHFVLVGEKTRYRSKRRLLQSPHGGQFQADRQLSLIDCRKVIGFALTTI